MDHIIYSLFYVKLLCHIMYKNLHILAAPYLVWQLARIAEHGQNPDAIIMLVIQKRQRLKHIRTNHSTRASNQHTLPFQLVPLYIFSCNHFQIFS